MSELTRLSQALIDEPLASIPTLGDLRSRSRQRHLRLRSAAVGLLALIVVAALSIVKVESSLSPSYPSRTNPPKVQLASYYEAAVAVSGSTLAEVGLPANVAIPTKITPSLSTVGTNGVVSYVGAEYCPYCAIQRWALLVALSKFGTFTNLNNQVISSSSDVYPRLASWSFVGAKYKSTYFTFSPTEVSSTNWSSDGEYKPLERMTKAQQFAFNTYNPQGGLPFVDVGNHFITLGASASPSVLEGLSLGAIGSDLSDSKSPVAQSIDGTANYLIAALCTMAQKAAPSICSTPLSRLASRDLDAGVSPTSTSSSANAAPTQPPANAPMSVWKRWSAAQHAYLLAAAANFRNFSPGCTILKIAVNGRKLVKPVLGIPAGVTVWSTSLTGKCSPKKKTGGGL